MKIAFKLSILIAISCLALAAHADYIFENGIVIAKIIGPSKPTPETLEPGPGGKWGYFYTTIEIVDVKNGFVKELKGKKKQVRTGSFDKNLIGKTMPLRVTSRKKHADSIPAILFGCSELSVAVTGAEMYEKQTQPQTSAK